MNCAHAHGLSTLKKEDWKLMVLLLVATGCMALRAAMERGQLPSPPHIIPYFSTPILVAYVVIPGLLAPFVRVQPFSFFRLGEPQRAVGALVLFAAIILIATTWLATTPSFIAYYGFVSRDSLPSIGVGVFLTMIGVEFFFRGFLLFPVADKFGWYAIPLTVMPYCLIHVGKPVLELFGSILVGSGFAYLALQTRSVLYGVILHWLLAMWLYIAPTIGDHAGCWALVPKSE